MIKLEKLKKVLANLDVGISGTALVLLVFLTLAGALSRRFLNHPFVWLEEVQLWLEVWVVFMGAGAAFRTGSHVAIEIIIDALPEKVQRIFDVIIAIIVAVTLGYLLWQSLGYVKLFIDSERTTSMLQLPYYFIYGVVPISCILMIVNYLYVFINRMKGIDVTEDKIENETEDVTEEETGEVNT